MVCRRGTPASVAIENRTGYSDDVNYFLAIVMGLVTAFYLAANQIYERQLGSSAAATVPFFLVAALGGAVWAWRCGELSNLQDLSRIAPVYIVTGAAAAGIVGMTTVLLPKLGAKAFFLLQLAGQVVAAALLSHFGLMGTPHEPLDARSVVGMVLFCIGAGLVIV